MVLKNATFLWHNFNTRVKFVIRELRIPNFFHLNNYRVRRCSLLLCRLLSSLLCFGFLFASAAHNNCVLIIIICFIKKNFLSLVKYNDLFP